MGIKGLLKFLREQNPDVRQTITLTEMKGHNIAVDIAIKAYAFKSEYITRMVSKIDPIYDDVDYSGATPYMFRKTIRMYIKMAEAGVVPVTVFDGKAPDLKCGTKDDRMAKSTNRRETIAKLREIGKALLEDQSYTPSADDIVFLQSFTPALTSIPIIKARLLTLIKGFITVTTEDYRQFEMILSNLGLPYVVAKSEAEKTCAMMTLHRDTLATMTTDSDCLMYGCPLMIDKLIYPTSLLRSTPLRATCYSLKAILETVALTPSQFMEFCIMCGTDFNPNPPGFGPSTNLQLLQTFGSVKGILKAKQIVDDKIALNPYLKFDAIERLLIGFDATVLNYAAVHNYITTPEPYDVKGVIIRTTSTIFQDSFEFMSSYIGLEVYNSLSADLQTLVTRILDLKIYQTSKKEEPPKINK